MSSFVMANHDEVSVFFEDEYRVEDKAVLYYNVTIHTDETVVIGYTDENDKDVVLYDESNVNPSDVIEVGGRIVHTFNDTGVYSVFKTVDDDKRYIGSITIKEASLPTLGVILGILVLIGIVLSLTVSPYVWLITVLLGLGSFISFMFRYKYVMDDGLFFGIFSLVFLVLAVVGEKMLEQLFK